MLSQSHILASRGAIIRIECSYTITVIYKLVLVTLPTMDNTT